MRRADEILLVGYWMARRGRPDGTPPAALAHMSWGDAYDSFAGLADGRTPEGFRNSLRNTRDQADSLFQGPRRGWRLADGSTAAGPALTALHERLRDTPDHELDRQVMRLSVPRTRG